MQKNDEVWKDRIKNAPHKLYAGTLDPFDFPSRAAELGFNEVDLLNTCFLGYRQNEYYLNRYIEALESTRVTANIMLIDECGLLGDSDTEKRRESIKFHKKWIGIASLLNCKAVRVNAHGKGSFLKQQQYIVQSLQILADYAAEHDCMLLVENYGGLSGHIDWLTETINKADHKNLKVLLDTDNFSYSMKTLWEKEFRFNRYEGIKKLLPLSYAMNVKAHDFNQQGRETRIDYSRISEIISAGDFSGTLSVKYEGKNIVEEEGILATKRMVECIF